MIYPDSVVKKINAILQNRGVLLAAKIIYFLFPLPVTWTSISLMSLHLEYYDIGINMTANNLYLLMFIFPILLSVLYLIAAVNILLTKRFFRSQWLGLCSGAIFVIITGIVAFAVHDHSLTNYPTEKPRNMCHFLRYYLTQIRE